MNKYNIHQCNENNMNDEVIIGNAGIPGWQCHICYNQESLNNKKCECISDKDDIKLANITTTGKISNSATMATINNKKRKYNKEISREL